MAPVYVALFFKVAFLCLAVSTKSCNGNLFGSLQFTRDALFGFSRVVGKPAIATSPSRIVGGDSGRIRQLQSVSIYRPSNKFLEIIHEIGKAVANAGAVDNRLRNNEQTKATLSRLLTNAVQSKSYKYARDVLGRVLHLLSTESSRRRKRSIENEGTTFLQELRQTLGNETFDSFMAVKGDVSLIFVVDDTGSMMDEIEAVKKMATAVVNYPREAPLDYILSPFNDPMSDAGDMVTKQDDQKIEFVQAINALNADSGGDCPEYTFQGILNALAQEPLFGSPMYVFTDAGPKDATAENIEEVKMIAEADEVTINFLSTGSCIVDKLHPSFLELSDFTSGQALLLRDASEIEKLKNTTGMALEGATFISMGSSLLGRKKRSTGRPSRYRFPIDDSIETVTISVKTTGRDTNGHGIILKDPSGATVTAEKIVLSQASVYHITKPATGYWTLEISDDTAGGYEFYVKSSSGTNINFRHYFMIPLGRGRRKAVVPFANPVRGKSNNMVLTLLAEEGKVNNDSLRLRIVTTSGAVIRELKMRSHDGTHYESSFIPPTTPFRLKLTGTTQTGSTFERLSHRAMKPTTAVLRAKHASNDFTLPLNVTTYLHFQICNFGDSELFEIILKKDRMNLIVHQSASSQRPRHVAKGRCALMFVRAKATCPEDLHKTNTVTLIAKGQSSGVIVSRVMRLLVVKPEG